MPVDAAVAEAEGGAQVDRPPSRVTIAGSLLVIAFFVVTYAYNTVSFDGDALRGDQWDWVESVVIPYNAGDMSLFDAVKWEFAPLSHSHIPTLMVFLFNYEFLGLDLSVDRVIGFASLAAILFIAYRHARGFLRVDTALVVTAVVSSMLFMSSSSGTFRWSLLQFQMLYVLVAFIYLRTFAIRHATQPFVHALIAMPAAMLFGDAIGVAAVLASLVYLGVLGLLRKAPGGSLVAYFGLFPVQLWVLTAVFRGERWHAETPIGEFITSTVERPRPFFEGLYNSLSTVLVALRPEDSAVPLLGWGDAPLWFALTAALGVLAAVLVWRSPLRTPDHLPILIILTGLIWIFGVLRARIPLWGPEAMQSARYAAYTTLIGVGLTLLLASKARFQPTLRVPLVAIAAFVVLANGLGSLKITNNQVWVDEQEQQLADLRAYVLDEAPEFDDGGHCLQRSCLRAAWFLHDMKLASFRDDDSPRPEWERELRNLSFDRFDDMTLSEQFDVCIKVVDSDNPALLEWALNEPPFELADLIERRGLETPESSESEAERLVVRALHAMCGQPTIGNPAPEVDQLDLGAIRSASGLEATQRTALTAR